MRGINFLAGLGTILIFTGIILFKAAFQKAAYKEKVKKVNDVPVKTYGKAFLLLTGSICFIAGLLLIAKALKVV